MYSFIQKSAAVRFGSLNTLLTLPVENDCVGGIAPMCVCVCVCVPCAPHGGLSDTSALEISSGGGSGLNSLPVRSPDFEKPWSRQYKARYVAKGYSQERERCEL